MLASCSNEQPNVEPTPVEITMSRSEIALTDNFNDFGMSLFNRMAENSKIQDQNFIVSPFSMAVNLSMIANITDPHSTQSIIDALGANSLNELNSLNYKLLKYFNDPSKANALTSTNSIWHISGIIPTESFKSTISDYYLAPTGRMDNDLQTAADAINKWAANHTAGRIDQVTDPDELYSTVIFVANATNFDGMWDEPFDESKTYPETFHGIRNDKEIDMMHTTLKGIYRWNDKWECFIMLYAKKEYALILIKPHEGVSLQEIATTISNDDINSIYDSDNPNWKIKYAHIKFPKIDQSFNHDFKDELIQLGIPLSVGADGMTGVQSIEPYDLRLKQFSKLTFDESGTKASTVSTGELMTVWNNYTGSVDFPLDTPFLYFIRNNDTGAIIYAGQFVQP